eukprot:2111600-Rhodomonas_salina.1
MMHRAIQPLQIQVSLLFVMAFAGAVQAGALALPSTLRSEGYLAGGVARIDQTRAMPAAPEVGAQVPGTNGRSTYGRRQ